MSLFLTRSHVWWSLAAVGLLAMSTLLPIEMVVAKDRSIALAPQEATDEPQADEDEDAPNQPTGKSDPLGDEARYKVPETNDVDQLMEFIEQVRTYKPRSPESAARHHKLAPKAIKAAADRILNVEKDKSSIAYKQASILSLAARIEMLDNALEAERKSVVDEVKKRLTVDKPSQPDLMLGLMLARTLEESDHPKLSADIYTTLAKVLKQSGNEQFAELSKQFEASARRVDLVGNPMKVEGVTIEGKPFDLKAYRGKVVLVDFWTTWCEPCREELPNVKQAYRDYHNRGFEVVGVSLDEDREALDQFLKDEKLPWVTLHDQDDEGNHPVADHYAIQSFPTVILVGKDGKVVSLNARGEELQKLLAKLLGPTGSAEPKSKGSADAKLKKS